MTAQRVANPGLVGGGDPAEGPWSQLEMLVGIVANELRLARWENARSRAPKGKAPKEPELVAMPGSDSKDSKTKGRKPRAPLSPGQADWLFARINGLS